MPDLNVDQTGENEAALAEWLVDLDPIEAAFDDFDEPTPSEALDAPFNADVWTLRSRLREASSSGKLLVAEVRRLREQLAVADSCVQQAARAGDALEAEMDGLADDNTALKAENAELRKAHERVANQDRPTDDELRALTPDGSMLDAYCLEAYANDLSVISRAVLIRTDAMAALPVGAVA